MDRVDEKMVVWQQSWENWLQGKVDMAKDSLCGFIESIIWGIGNIIGKAVNLFQFHWEENGFLICLILFSFMFSLLIRLAESIFWRKRIKQRYRKLRNSIKKEEK